MNKLKILEGLFDYNREDAEKYASYCERLATEKNKDGTIKNPFAQKISDERFITYFKQVARDGLVFDGVHITWQSTGISYDYVAYKNRMLNIYPESIIDIQLVYEGDGFTFSKNDGKIIYSHSIKNPFNCKDEDIIGGYCVIKNKRGEFLTTLSEEDLIKHRKVAKTDYIWKAWYKEMCLKTIMKKAVKLHFNDIYTNIEETDNENYDLSNPLDLELKWKQEIDGINDLKGLLEYYNKNKGKGKEFDKYLTKRKEQILSTNK